MDVADIDYDKCRICQNGACVNRFASYARPDRVAALCNRTCLCHLEESSALSNKFENSFRKRDAWEIGRGNAADTRDVDSYNTLGGEFKKGASK